MLPADLFGWVYTGLSGRPDEKSATRRYVKGLWVLELMARVDRKSTTRVVTIERKQRMRIGGLRRLLRDLSRRNTP